jgi:hypothetical protein
MKIHNYLGTHNGIPIKYQSDIVQTSKNMPTGSSLKWKAVFLFLFISFVGFARDCLLLDCTDIKMRIIPEFSNTDNGCSASPECSSSDPFHQIIYRVDLNYVPSGSSFTPFYLDYEEVISGVKLSVSDPAMGNFSRINWKATVKCNMEATNLWNEESMSFDEGLQKILMRFEDYSSDDCDGDLLLFESFFNGSGINGRAHLFDVVVDAYPGETINLECDQFEYHADNLINCNMNPISPAEEAASCEPYTPITIQYPNPSSGINNDILVAAQAPSVAMNGDVSFDIVVKNLNGFASRELTYLEFSAILALDQVMIEPLITSSGLPWFKTIDNNDRIYRFSSYFSSLIIAASGTETIATITIKGPVLENLCWSATLSTPFNSSAPTSRLRTTEGDCSALNLSAQSQSFSETNCQFPCEGDVDQLVAFDILAQPDNSGCGIIVQVGLVPLDPLIKALTLDKFKFRITLDKSTTMAVEDIDYGPFTCTNVSSSCNSVNNDPSLEFDFDYIPSLLLDISSGAYLTFHLDGMGCFSGAGVDVRSIQLSGVDQCVPPIQPFLNNSVCTPSLTGTLLTEKSEGVESATVEITPNETCSSLEVYSDVKGFWGTCDPCPAALKFTVTPTLDLDPLNGVNTWDLVLVSRHILGLEPLNTPYKLIAADANKSGTITTFDIVEFRKLILGTYTSIPQNTSWRFVDADQTFANPMNPFAEVIHGSIENISLFTTALDFVGIKIGDVDISVTPNNRPGALGHVPVSWTIPTAVKNQDFITVPIIYQGSLPLEAIQFSLQFDPTGLELVTPSEGNIPGFTAGSFGLKKVSEGIINALWFINPTINDAPLQQGDIMFYLTFKVKGLFPEDGSWLRMNNEGMACNAWDAAGSLFSVVPESADAQARNNIKIADSSDGLVKVLTSPNPVINDLNFFIQSPEEGKASLGIFGPFGNSILVKRVYLSKGEQQLELSELGSLPAGVYNWRLWSTAFKTSGTLVKQ